MSSVYQKRRPDRRLAGFAAVLLMATASLLAIGNLPAYANSSEPIAIGVFRAGDLRVLQVSGDGTSNNSPIVASTYVAGVSGADVARQRWKLEPLPGGEGFPDYAYRIRHVASGKCLDKTGTIAGNNAPIILYTCNGKPNQVWWTGTQPSDKGTQLMNYDDYRCMVLKGASTANNTPLISYDCNGGWNEYYKLRTGSFDCGERSREWTGWSRMCIRGSQNFPSITTSLKHRTVALAYKNPSSFVLSNVVQQYTEITPIDAQGIAGGAVEYGWQAARTSSTVATPVYNSYWLETRTGGQQYHAVPATDEFGAANGSTVADGRGHSYLLAGTGTSGQWDVYFDYNRVGTTTGQIGGRMRDSETGLRVRYLDAATLALPAELRTQLMDENGTVRRPYYNETAVSTPKQCNMPPVWDDFSGGAGENLPPWCLDASRTSYEQPDWPLQADVFTVRKPTSTTSAANAPALRVSRDSFNGVDQHALVACMDNDANQCLSTVPGLRECIARRVNTCNVTAPATPAAAARRVRTSVAEVRKSAAAQLRLAGATTRQATADTARTTTVGELRSQIPQFTAMNIADSTTVHVLTGDDTVTGMTDSDDSVYHGWTMVYLADGGSLLYAQLGR